MSHVYYNGVAYNTTRWINGSAFNTTLNRWLLDKNDVRMIDKSVLRTIFCSTWLGLFFAVLLTFVVLSTPAQRRGPIFGIQVISFLLALVYNVQEVIIYFQRVDELFNREDQPIDWTDWLNIHVADISLEHIIPLIADTAVLFKIRSFYPSPLYTQTYQLFILSPLIALLIPRVALTIAGTYFAYREQSSVIWLAGHVFPTILGFEWNDRMKITFQIEFGLGALYCAYSAAVLLTKARQFSERSLQIRREGIRRRIRFFIEALLMSFVPPMAFSIAAVATLQCPPTKYCYYREMTGSLVNSSVLFGLLATSWSSIRAANDSKKPINDDCIESSAQMRDRSIAQSTTLNSKVMPHALIHVLFTDEKKQDSIGMQRHSNSSHPSSLARLRMHEEMRMSAPSEEEERNDERPAPNQHIFSALKRTFSEARRERASTNAERYANAGEASNPDCVHLSLDTNNTPFDPIAALSGSSKESSDNVGIGHLAPDRTPYLARTQSSEHLSQRPPFDAQTRQQGAHKSSTPFPLLASHDKRKDR